MVQNPNQFNQTEIQGQLDFLLNNNVISVKVDASQATPLVAGQAVKLFNSAGRLPTIVATANNADPAFGFVIRNLKDQTFPLLSSVEIALNDSVMYMNSNAAIARGGNVEVNVSDQTVGPALGVNTPIGVALDQASASGQLIRVYISTVGQPPLNLLQSTNLVVTLAQLNAGQVLIPAVAGKRITVTEILELVTGAFTGGTNIIVQSTNATPVNLMTTAEAGLTNGALLGRTSTNVTAGVGYGQPLGVGDGLRVISTGTQAGGTSVAFTLSFTQF